MFVVGTWWGVSSRPSVYIAVGVGVNAPCGECLVGRLPRPFVYIAEGVGGVNAVGAVAVCSALPVGRCRPSACIVAVFG